MKLLLAVTLRHSSHRTRQPRTFAGSAALDAATEQAIRDGLIPGAVIIIGHDGKIVHRKAYGARALVPAREAATLDTIYDIASLTKVVATTPAIMKLYEQGKIKLDDPVTAYLPEFQGGKSNITIRNLMTHYSGLRPDLDIDPAWSGYDTGIRKALIDKPAGPPGRELRIQRHQFRAVRRDRSARERPAARSVRARADFRAAGDARHDVQARGFAASRGSRRRKSTSQRANRGEGSCTIPPRATWAASRGTPVCSRLRTTSRAMRKRCSTCASSRRPRSRCSLRPPRRPISRSCAASAGISTRRILPIAAISSRAGHPTDIRDSPAPSLWIDPASKSFVVIMTNRVHPKGGRSINEWRRTIATIAASGLGLGPKNHVEC